MTNPFIREVTNRRYLDAIEDHVVLFDGATGTELAKHDLTADDYGGARTKGLNEMLVLHRPEVVADVHRTYFEAGAEVVETDTFRGNRLTLAEFGVVDRVQEINREAAALARTVADEIEATTGTLRFVAGTMGPTGKLPSLDDPALSDVTFDALTNVYAEQARALIEGGVDVLLLETQQDLLELKAAVHGIWRAFDALGVRLPIQAQMTLEAGRHILTGPDVEAALATLAALPVDIIGMNCSTGPEEMRGAVRRLLALTNRPVSVLPNAGMPENVGGRAVYTMEPEPFAVTLAEFAEWGVRVVGGCCGTGPAHIRQLKSLLVGAKLSSTARAGLPTKPPAPRPLPPAPRPPCPLLPVPYVASNVHAVALHQEPRPLIVGERINTQGSRRARRLVLNREYEALLSLAEHQVGYGAHVLDVCVALTERDDEAETMTRLVKLLSLNTQAPLMIDTTDVNVMRAALTTYPGRAILNSVHLEAGESRAREILTLARDFGAAVVALTIDEAGMAKTTARKVAVARRLHALAVDEVGLPPHALIFDPLTFTLATGDPESAGAAVATLDALREIKAALPGVLTNLGVSNVSYGLKGAARRVLNSVFLYHALEAGLDLAIVNPAQITPYPDIPADVRRLAEDLIFNRTPEALANLIAHFEGITETETAPVAEALPPDEALFQAVVRRQREGVEAKVDACLQEAPPLHVLNAVLLPAMKEVGDRFGAGELILPFVLKSAETMKAAIQHLEPHFEQADATSKGVVVLATVFGDVHDIGKNLVKTILANNGYTVHDLGKQVPAEEIVARAVAVGVDAIGLSALLVATSKQMARVVRALQRRGLRIPVLVGGAAVNPNFALRIASDAEGVPYAGGVHYCADAFEALQVLENVILRQPMKPPADHHHHEGHGQETGPSYSDEEMSAGAGVLTEPQETQAACATCAANCPISSSASPSAEADLPSLAAGGLNRVPSLAGAGVPTEPTESPESPVPLTPPFWGPQVLEAIPLEEIRPFLDTKSLFRVGWGAKGARGEQWARLQAEFEARLDRMWAEADYLHPQAAYGYVPAQSEGDAIVIYDPDALPVLREMARFCFPRQSVWRAFVSGGLYRAFRRRGA